MNLTLMENFENKTIDYCQVHKWIFTDVIFNIILMLYYFDCFCDIVPKIKTMICIEYLIAITQPLIDMHSLNCYVIWCIGAYMLWINS